MDLGTRTILLTAGSAAALLGGIALVLIGDAALATVGILLVIVSAITFLVDAKDFIVESDAGARE